MARAATGRSVVLRFNGHYHGWVDNIYSRDGGSQAAPASPGQAESALRDVLTIEWNDTEASECAVSARAEDLAAVIMEPVMIAAAMAAGYPCAAIAGRRPVRPGGDGGGHPRGNVARQCDRGRRRPGFTGRAR